MTKNEIIQAIKKGNPLERKQATKWIIVNYKKEVLSFLKNRKCPSTKLKKIWHNALAEWILVIANDKLLEKKVLDGLFFKAEIECVKDAVKSGDAVWTDFLIKEKVNSAKEVIAGYLIKKGCEKEKISTIISDTELIFLENVRQDKFKGYSEIRTYLVSIAKNKFLGMITKRNRQTASHTVYIEDPQLIKQEEEMDKIDLLFMNSCLTLMKAKHELNKKKDTFKFSCYELFDLLKLGENQKEIANKFGTSHDAMRTRITRCRQEAMKCLKMKKAKYYGAER